MSKRKKNKLTLKPAQESGNKDKEQKPMKLKTEQYRDNRDQK